MRPPCSRREELLHGGAVQAGAGSCFQRCCPTASNRSPPWLPLHLPSPSCPPQDATNQPTFPPIILRPGGEYNEETVGGGGAGQQRAPVQRALWRAVLAERACSAQPLPHPLLPPSDLALLQLRGHRPPRRQRHPAHVRGCGPRVHGVRPGHARPVHRVPRRQLRAERGPHALCEAPVPEGPQQGALPGPGRAVGGWFWGALPRLPPVLPLTTRLPLTRPPAVLMEAKQRALGSPHPP